MTTKTPQVKWQGNPPSGTYQPVPADLVQYDEEIAAQITTLEALGVQGYEMTSGGPVAVATTANITLSGEQTIDGVLTSADRVLVKDQTAPAQNGIYVTAAGAWARATDMDAAAEVEGTGIYASGGTAFGGKTFICYSAVTTIGTDAIYFVEGPDNSGVQGQIDTLVGRSDVLEVSQNLSAPIYENAKLDLPILKTNGGISNGAQWWDGTTTVGATSASKGIFIPIGSTGQSSYLRFYFNFTASRSAELAGRTVKFMVPFVTSSGFMDALTPWLFGGSASPTNGTWANRAMTKVSDTVALYSFDYTFVGDETQINAYPQINNATALSVDHNMHASEAFYMVLDTNGFSDVIDQFTAALDTSVRTYIDNDVQTDFGPKIRPDNSFTNGVSNGAALNTPGDIYDGFTIPAASTGYQSYYSAPFIIGFGRAKSLVGKTCRFIAEFETSAGALATRAYVTITSVLRVTGTTAALGTFSNVQLIQATPTRAFAVADFTFTGVEASVSVGLQQSANLVGDGTENSIKPISMHYVEIGADGFGDAVLQAIPTETQYFRTIVVNPDGSGDFLTLKAAVEAEGTAGIGVSRLQRVKYEVHEGIYTDTEYDLPNFADIVGIGRRENVWLKGYLPDSTATGTIQLTSTILMNGTTKIENIRVTAQNMRYPIHSDSSASANRALQEIVNCDIEHFGNDEARQWQTDNGGNPANVWAQEQAWGCGTHSGQRILSARTRWTGGGEGTAFGFHTNKDFIEGNYVELDQCQIVNPKGGVAVGMIENGSKVPHEFVLNGCQIDGTIVISSAGWLTTSPLVDQGDGTGMCRTYLSGCSPVAWTSNNNTNVLDLRSIDDAASAVVVSGTGADALFGEQPVTIYGGIGYPARVYSEHQINGVSGTGLGARLGDCTTVNKTLTITFDGGAASNLTLNLDYTADSNATVISALNTLMADGAGRAFYETNGYTNEAPLYQLDREVTVKNTSTTTVILKGMAVAYDSGFHLGRIATSVDAQTLIAGIALENIAPGQMGRVQKSGHIDQAQIKFNGTPAIVFGDVFGVSATAGEIIEGASITLLRAVSADVLEIIQ